ncbi:MAG: hypothetical protein NZ480_09445 [Bdellovibrionaceae bacterium]|nr:hypothetical protein [Pseudobdellovibrionaceae bacterium]MDW8191019.1 hypothetical protein [Pseudobdellovibrionaceae bacterium]
MNQKPKCTSSHALSSSLKEQLRLFGLNPTEWEIHVILGNRLILRHHTNNWFQFYGRHRNGIIETLSLLDPFVEHYA